MNYKFKVGDKARIIFLEEMDMRPGIKVGDIVTVDEDSYVPLCTLSNGKCMAMNERQLERVETKIKEKSKIQIVYKVVYMDYTSCIVGGDKELLYKLEKRTKVSKGMNPIFVFDTHKNALASIGGGDLILYRILKCVGRVVKNDFSFMSDPLLSNGPPPKGTLLCRWVFPIEEVESYV